MVAPVTKRIRSRVVRVWREVGESRQICIEQAIARGWSRYRIIDELGVTEIHYETVRHNMDKVVADG